MKKILIVAHFCNDFEIKGNNRFNYITEKLAKDYDVELITTDFSHRKKDYRDSLTTDIKYSVKMVHEPRYNKNISIKRLYAHGKFGRNLKKYLFSMEKKPDIIYCAIPSLDAAKAVAKYAKKNNVRFVIDIQDLWPEAFQMVLNVPGLFYPMKKKADYVYKAADEILSVSETYARRAEIVSRKKAKAVFIGTNLAEFDRNVSNNVINRDDAEFWIGYCGSLSRSYDVGCVIEALAILKKEGYLNLKLLVMGNGTLHDEFEEKAKENNVNAEFFGHVPYPEMCAIISACDISVNPIVAGSAGSIINKHADYAAAGIPVVNSQECVEYRNLIDEYNMGLNCINSNPEDMAQKIKELIDDKSKREKMGKNARRCAKEKFDRDYTYQEIFKVITE